MDFSVFKSEIECEMHTQMPTHLKHNVENLDQKFNRTDDEKKYHEIKCYFRSEKSYIGDDDVHVCMFVAVTVAA